MNTKLCIAAFTLAFTCCASAQGAFQNLNFESANPIPLVGSPYYPYAVASSNGIPGWNAYLGNNAVDWLFLNTVSIGAAAVSLQSSTSTFPPIAGNYSLILQPQFNPNNPPGLMSAAIAQAGQIPASAQSLRFYSGSESMQATFAGQNIPLVQLGITGSYLILGGDISGFASQTGELRFTMPSVVTSYNIPYLDNIIFSSQPIPEPSTLGLFGLGTLFLGWRLRRTGFAPLLLVPSVSQIGNNQFGIARKLTRA